MLNEITRKIVSYCEIPEELTEKHWISEHGCGVYIDWSLNLDPKTDDDISAWIREEYPELIGTTFLIDIDY